jgi:hypothetical protein
MEGRRQRENGRAAGPVPELGSLASLWRSSGCRTDNALPANAASDDIITFAGQRISSVFEGLLPSRYAQRRGEGVKSRDAAYSWQDRLEQDRLWGLRSGRRYLGARYVQAQCGQCLLWPALASLTAPHPATGAAPTM